MVSTSAKGVTSARLVIDIYGLYKRDAYGDGRMIRMTIDDGIVTFAAIGKLSVDELIEQIDIYLQHPDRVEGMPSIWDGREADMSIISPNELRKLALAMGPHMNKFGTRSAIVVRNPLQFGMARVWQAFAEQKAPQQRRIFMNIEQARLWLLSETY